MSTQAHLSVFRQFAIFLSVISMFVFSACGDSGNTETPSDGDGADQDIMGDAEPDTDEGADTEPDIEDGDDEACVSKLICPTEVDFGNVLLSQQACRDVSITNTGDTSITITKAEVFGNAQEFTVLDGPCGIGNPVDAVQFSDIAIAAGEGTMFGVQYTPVDPGPDEVQLVVTTRDDPCDNSHSIALVSRCKGECQLTATPGLVDFGSLAADVEPQPQTVVFANECLSTDDNVTLQIGDIRQDGSPKFTLNNCMSGATPVQLLGLLLPPGDDVTCEVGFQGAMRSSVFDGSFTISTTPQPCQESRSTTVQTHAVVDSPMPVFMPANNVVSFCYSGVGTTPPETRSLILKNNGTVAFTLLSVAVDPANAPFYITSGTTENITLEPDEELTLGVAFEPQYESAFAASLLFTFDFRSAPYAVTLLGRSVDVCPDGFVSEGCDCIPSRCYPTDRIVCDPEDIDYRDRLTCNSTTGLYSIPATPCPEGQVCVDGPPPFGSAECRACEFEGQIECFGNQPKICRNFQFENLPSCNDAVACTQDMCDATEATGCAHIPVDALCDDTNDCTEDACDPSSQVADKCVHTDKADDTVCDDDLFCIEDTTCQSGRCVGETRDCNADEDYAGCKTQVCNEALGQCTETQTNLPNGTPCDDGDEGTTEDQCTDGVCAGTPPANCSPDDGICCINGQPVNDGQTCADDENDCTDDICSASGVCTHLSKTVGVACGTEDQCFGGSCVDCTDASGCDDLADDGFECSEPVCNPETNTCEHDLTAHSGELCTDDNLTCTQDLCDDQGQCSHDTLEDNTCLIDAACYQAGEAQDVDYCVICDPAVNTTAWTNADGTECAVSDDTNPCTDNVCQGGVCTYANNDANACEDSLGCTATACQSGSCEVVGVTGCFIDGACIDEGVTQAAIGDGSCRICNAATATDAWTVLENGESCDDGDGNSFGEVCTTGGVCLGCTPDCDGKECGDDGCGGSCGECGEGESCGADQVCSSCEYEVVWEKLEGNDVSYVADIITDSEGNYVLIWHSFAGSLGGMKLSPSGDVIWQNQYESGQFQAGKEIIQDDDGNYVILGYSSDNGGDIQLTKIGHEGSLIWQNTYGGAEREMNLGGGIVQIVDGSYVVAGNTSSKGAGSYDVWVLNIDKTGNLIWDHTYGFQRDEFGIDIIVNNGGNLSIAAQRNELGGCFLWYLEIDLSGDIIASKHFDENRGVEPTSLIQTDSGNYIMSGSKTIDNIYQFYFFSFTPEGEFVWQDQIAYPLKNALIDDMIAGNSGNIFALGRIQDGVEFMVSIIEYSPLGTLLQQVNRSYDFTSLGGLSIDKSNNIITAGCKSSTENGKAWLTKVSNSCNCSPYCIDKQCGDDGCGGSCGECGIGEFCTVDGQCVPQQAVPPTGQESCYTWESPWEAVVCPGVAGTETCGSVPGCGQDAQYPENAQMFKCYNADGTLQVPCGDTAYLDEVVEDAVTGLMWQRTLQVNKTWQEAIDYCESIDYGGYQDWHLPTIQELQGIVDSEANSPAINTSVFVDDPPYFSCWSSDIDANNDDRAWTVYFDVGDTGSGVKTSANWVRCVRGGSGISQGASRFSIIEPVASEEIVTDMVTGLTWMASYSTGNDWRSAMAYCESQSYGNFSDWRLPDKNELLTLTDLSRQSPASKFPQMPPQMFFSSTSVKTSGPSPSSTAWSVNFDIGNVSGANLKNQNSYVRCVRGGPPCNPQCDGRECGSDGCGGSCSPGCQAHETCTPEGLCENEIPQEIVLKDGVVILDDTTAATVDSPVCGTMQFPLEGGLPPFEVVAGNTIVSGYQGGFLCTVNAVSQTATHLALDTTQGSLDDVIAEGSLAFSVPVEIGSEQNRKGTSVSLGLSPITLLDTGSSSVMLRPGSLTFQPSFDVEASWGPFAGTYFRAVANGSITADMGIDVDIHETWELNGSAHIYDQSFPFYFVAAGLPVTGTVRVEIIPGFTATAQADLTSSFGATAYRSISAGAEYYDSQWHAININSQSGYNIYGPDIDGAVSLSSEVRLDVKMTLNLYKAASAYIQAAPRVEGDVSANVNLQYDWDLNACIWAGYGGDITIFHRTLASYSSTLFNRCWDIWDGSDCFNACSPENLTCMDAHTVEGCGEAGDGDNCLEYTSYSCEEGFVCNAGACVPQITDACSSGICCDTTVNPNQFKTSSTICESNAIFEYGCPWGTECGSDTAVHYKDRHCSGDSADCTGSLSQSWTDWQVSDDCLMTEKCNPTGYCEPCCDNTCPQAGEKQCITETTFHTCGDYNSDGCVEWNATPESCGAGNICDSGQCFPCGDVSEYCCANSSCNGTLECVSGTCIQNQTACGSQGEECCSDNYCDASLVCITGICSAATGIYSQDFESAGFNLNVTCSGECTWTDGSTYQHAGAVYLEDEQAKISGYSSSNAWGHYWKGEGGDRLLGFYPAGGINGNKTHALKMWVYNPATSSISLSAYKLDQRINFIVPSGWSFQQIILPNEGYAMSKIFVMLNNVPNTDGDSGLDLKIDNVEVLEY